MTLAVNDITSLLTNNITTNTLAQWSTVSFLRHLASQHFWAYFKNQTHDILPTPNKNTQPSLCHYATTYGTTQICFDWLIDWSIILLTPSEGVTWCRCLNFNSVTSFQVENQYFTTRNFRVKSSIRSLIQFLLGIKNLRTSKELYKWTGKYPVLRLREWFTWFTWLSSN